MATPGARRPTSRRKCPVGALTCELHSIVGRIDPAQVQCVQTLTVGPRAVLVSRSVRCPPTDAATPRSSPLLGVASCQGADLFQGPFLEGGLIGMASRPCLDCGTPSPGTRCGGCTRARGRVRDAMRGSSTERGYDHAHEQTRALLLPHAIGTPCPRCSEIMHVDEPLDLGHSEGLRENKYSRGDRIEHARCNRGNK